MSLDHGRSNPLLVHGTCPSRHSQPKCSPTCPCPIFLPGTSRETPSTSRLGTRRLWSGKMWSFSFPSCFLQFNKVGANHNWIFQPQRGQSKATSQPQPQQKALITAKCGERFSCSALEAMIYLWLISKSRRTSCWLQPRDRARVRRLSLIQMSVVVGKYVHILATPQHLSQRWGLLHSVTGRTGLRWGLRPECLGKGINSFPFGHLWLLLTSWSHLPIQLSSVF